MGFLDLLSWMGDRVAGPESGERTIDGAVVELADNATGDGVTAEVLSNRTERSYVPIVDYLDEDEQPEYVFRGGPLLISDAEDAFSRQFPSRETQVVISDRRILFLVGGRISDDIWEVPLGDVVDMYVDDAEELKRYLVVEAERESTLMTFFADVTLDPNPGAIGDSVEFVETVDE